MHLLWCSLRGAKIAINVWMTSRAWRVDSLRGYFLVVMTLGHLPPHPLQRFFSYSFGYASAPDGFVFLSGLVSTWVYLRVRNKHGQRALETRVLGRTRDIYLVHIFLLSASIAEGVLLANNSFQSTYPVRAFLSGSLLLYQPALSDILPMYCIFLLFTPIVLDQMTKGRAWLVGMTSASLWCAAQWGVGDASYSVPWISLGSFNILAWQAYFVAGQYLGYRSSRGEKRTSEITRLAGGLYCACAAFFPGPSQRGNIRNDAGAEVRPRAQPESGKIPGRGLPWLCDLVASEEH